MKMLFCRDDIETQQVVQYQTPITLRIDGRQSFLIPSKGNVRIEGKFTKKDATLYSARELNSLVNNLMYSFRCIKYTLDDLEIESIKYPGRCVSMAKATRKTGSDCHFTSVCGTPETSKEDDQTPKDGSFILNIPLSHIFGFCEDFENAVYGYRHEVQFFKSSESDKAPFVASGFEPGKMDITNMSIRMSKASPDSVVIKGQQEVSFRAKSMHCYGNVANRVDGFNKFTWLVDHRDNASSVLFAFGSDEKRNVPPIKSIRLNDKLPNIRSVQLLPYDGDTVFSFDESEQHIKLQVDFADTVPQGTNGYALVRHTDRRVV